MSFFNLFRSNPVPGAIWLSRSTVTNAVSKSGRVFVRIESVKNDWVMFSGDNDGQTSTIPDFHRDYAKTELVFTDPVLNELWCFRWAEENPDPFYKDFRRYTITRVTANEVTSDDGKGERNSVYTSTFMRFHNIYCRPKIDTQIHASSERPDPFRIQDHGTS